MSAKKSLRKHNKFLGLLWCCILTGLVLGACGGGSSGGGSNGGDGGTNPPTTTEPTWQPADILSTVNSSGTSARVVAMPEGADLLHLAHFDKIDDENSTVEFHYLKIQLGETGPELLEEDTTHASIDNDRTLEMALDVSMTPLITYRGGSGLNFCTQQQSDLMISMPSTNGWDEYTAAMGYNPRSPAEILQDGMVGDLSAIAVDSQNRAHIIYTFLYEGCDSINHKFHDLRYVRIDASAPGGELVEEEIIQENDYPSFNEVGSDGHNSVGHHGDIVLDADEHPLVFYGEIMSDHNSVVNHDYGLRVAAKDGTTDEWAYEWVEKDVDVKAISAAVAQDGTVGVAYAILLEDEDEIYSRYLLKYAERDTQGDWNLNLADETASVGTHCALAFSTDNEPLIAYYAIKSHSQSDLNELRFAWRSSGSWQQETVASAGDIGRYNNLWVDANGYPNIVTYKSSSKEIRHYVKR
jgi:hypothetical protein